MRPPRRSRPAADASIAARLSDLDHEILEQLCQLRVLTETQLERLHPVVPGRTMRYRTLRLHRLGLVGRTRPYRDTGSAPHHLWPKQRADALVRGEAPPRRGESRSPNPLMLAHSAAIAELYVVLLSEATQAAGLRLEGFRREGEAREPFKGAGGRDRAIAPDVLITVRDAEGRELRAHVEIDLGTMSHARLRTKLEGYLAYTEQRAWQARHDFQPALLFITTGRSRADTFAAGARRLAGSKRWAPHTGDLMLAVSAQARHLEDSIAGRGWRDVADQEAHTLAEVLAAARGPHDRRLAAQQAQQQALEAERGHLVADPEALRQHLRDHAGLHSAVNAHLQPPSTTALDLLIDATGPPDPAERDTLGDLGRQLAEHLPADYRTPQIQRIDPRAVEGLVDHYRRIQLTRIQQLAAAHGRGPQLRQADARLNDGGLLDPLTIAQLPGDARRDAQTRDAQQQLRAGYLEHRNHETRKRARDQPLGTRLRRGPETHLNAVDADWLRICGSCGETVYPSQRPAVSGGEYAVPYECAYCASRDLQQVVSHGRTS